MTRRSLYNFARGGQRSFRGGASLVEMMVSIGITVGMLAAAGVVYKSAGDASGQAMANSVIMEQYRALTRQLKTDFTGLRPDMPMAIIFEADAYGNRYDRIVFFADGDFQVNDYGTPDTVSANLARIFYGQSSDAPPTPAHAPSPSRQILARKFNLITSNEKNWRNFFTVYTGLPVPGYDYYPIDYALSLADWKNMPFDIPAPVTIDFLGTYFIDNLANSNYRYSIIRRPNIDSMVMNTGYAGLNRLYFLPDVTDLKIQLWYENTNAYVNGRWFPDYWDISPPPLPPSPFDNIARNLRFAFFWNVLNAPNAGQVIDMGTEWWSEDALKNVFTWQNTWPKAIKFTFTLYDKNRHHYPQGRTFSYIIDLPPR